jgi:hypothetical protein
MTSAKLVCALLLAACLPASSQLVLNQGDTWAYEFSALSYMGQTSSFQAPLIGLFVVSVNDNTLQPGDSLLLEMFEDQAAGIPLASNSITFGSPSTQYILSAGAWQDVQGAVRLTMSSGSVMVDRVQIEAIVSGPSLSSYNVYATEFTPTPEPATWSLWLAGLAVGFLWRSRAGHRPVSPRDRHELPQGFGP